MKEKKAILRTCVESKEVLEKKDLIRIVRNKDGVVAVDLTGKMNGRGAYLKRDSKVILSAKKSKALDRKLEASVPDEIYEELLEIVK